MNNKKMILFLVLFICSFFFSKRTVFADTISKDGWDIDVTWQYGLVSKINATYSITQDKINNDGSIDIDLSPVLMFMAYDASTYGMSFGSTPKLNLSLKNETGKKITFDDYSFNTYSYEDWGDIISNDVSDMTIIGSGFNTVAFGNVLSAYYPFLNEDEYDITKGETGTAPTINILGFDGKPIRAGFLSYRTQSPAMIALLGKNNLTVTKISNLDELVKEEITFTNVKGDEITLEADSGRTYGQYVKAYYDVESLDELTDEQLKEYFDSEDQIKGYDNISLVGYGKGYKYLKINDLNSYVNDNFKHWGQATVLRYNNEYVFGAFFMIESDPEIQQLAYKYIFKDVIRFTFDSTVNPVSNNFNTNPYGGNLGLINYINKTEKANQMVYDAFEYGKYIDNGESINLPNIQSAVIPVDTFDQYNMFDFGISLKYVIEKDYKRDVILTNYGEDINILLKDVIYKLQYQTSDDSWNDMDDYLHLTTDENGKIELKDLDIGKYRLIQKIVPAGYKLNDDPIEFIIEETNDTTPLLLTAYNIKEELNEQSNIISNQNPAANTGIINNPKTDDNIYKYFIIAMISIVCIIETVLFYKKIIIN